jgi:spore maturation protein CgeB
VVTTTQGAFDRYQALNINNVILSQWAANHRLYYPMPVEKKYDVTFVGQPHGDRREIVERLRNDGIQVATWGHGWEAGRLTQMEMVRLFSQSKINLNFANALVPGLVQIKGRNFEVPACRAFLLTTYVPELENYYGIDGEVVCFTGYDELRDKIRYYLAHDEERENIAARGYQRTLAQHTFDARFDDIFCKAGLA